MNPADTAMPDPRHELEPSPRWVRVRFAGQVVADSKRGLLLRAPGRLPVYYFPQEDVRAESLVPAGHTEPCLHEGARCWTVRVGDRAAKHAAWGYPDPPPDRLGLRGYVAFEWSRMDAWFEEDDEVYVHARDPYKRVDVLHSSRHVRVVVAGELVAETRRPSLLFETGLPTRYYLPKADVRMDRLVPTETETRCPYKGVASYYSVRTGTTVVEDVAWYYRHPIPECSKIENLVCFFNERVDALYVDGERGGSTANALVAAGATGVLSGLSLTGSRWPGPSHGPALTRPSRRAEMGHRRRRETRRADTVPVP